MPKDSHFGSMNNDKQIIIENHILVIPQYNFHSKTRIHKNNIDIKFTCMMRNGF